MSYEEDNQVDLVRNRDGKKQEKALKKLDKQNHDIRTMSQPAIIWHLVVRNRRVWFWFGLVLTGYIIGYFA